MKTSTTPHWSNCGFGGAVGVGIGPDQEDLTSAAQAVVDYFQTHPCTRDAIPVVGNFQLMYNASGMPGQLTVDQQYGGNTQRAVQNALNTAPAAGDGGPVQSAPPNCFGMAVPDIPAVDPPTSGGSAATTTTTTTTTPPAASGGASSGAIALAVAAVVGGVGYAVYRARKRH